jgi:hypothetical protein
MATFKGFISQALPEQSGVSKSGKTWRKRTYVLTYDSSKPEYPKAVVFDVMNDNIDKLNLQAGAEYEVEVDFAVREYQGKFYQSASAWKATPTQQPTPQPQSAPAQPTQPTRQGDDSLPF